MENDPFTKLVRPKAQLDYEAKQRLADLLEPYIWVDPEHISVVFKPTAPAHTTLQRVLLFMLSRKVMALISPEVSAHVAPREVETGTGLPGGTVRPKLADLIKRKLVVRSDGAYEVAPYFSLNEIEQILKSGL